MSSSPPPTQPTAPTPPDDDQRPADAAVSEPIAYEAARHDPYEVLRLRDYRNILLGWFVAILGSQAQSVAVGYEVFRRTKDPLMLGYVGLAQAVPLILLSLPAGALADRVDRRLIMLCGLGVAGACSVGLAIATVTAAPLWLMYGLLLVSACASAASWPARSSITPKLVPQAMLANASTWNSSVFQLASVIGPALGGQLVAVAPPWAAFASCAAGTAAFAVTVVLVRADLRPERSTKAAGSRWQELATGVRFVWRTKLILATLSLDLLAVLLGGAVFMLPAYADEVLQVGPRELGWLRAADPVGALAMALYLAHRPPMRQAGRSLLLAVAGFGVATVVFGLSTNLWLSMAALMAAGACDNVSVVVRHTIVQMMTPDSMRGRVSAVNNIFIGSSNDLGGFESGLMAKYMGLVRSVVVGGVGTIVVVAAVAAKWPVVRRMGRLDGLRPPDGY